MDKKKEETQIKDNREEWRATQQTASGTDRIQPGQRDSQHMGTN
jgi:hypothetical protein